MEATQYSDIENRVRSWLEENKKPVETSLPWPSAEETIFSSAIWTVPRNGKVILETLV